MVKEPEPNIVSTIKDVIDRMSPNELAASILALVVAGIVFCAYGVPAIKYQAADAMGKCQINLKKLNDSDKFCDEHGKLQSHKKIEAKKAETARRASLTPMQRCEEDHQSFADPDGEGFMVICKSDGSYEIKSVDEIQAELETDMYPTENTPSSNCNPNYVPCVANSAYDLDCADIGVSVQVVGYDVYGLDGDGDGTGCDLY